MLLRGLMFLCGSSNPVLCRRVAEDLKIKVSRAEVKRFSDGEVNVRVVDSVRSHDIYIFQSLSNPGNDHLMELLLMIDACRRASAGRVNAVIPYLGYSRQDRVTHGRVPISAKVIANVLTSVGVDRVISVDIHADQIEGFFDRPVEHLRAGEKLLEHFIKLRLEDVVVVAPDSGGVERASRFADGLGSEMALIDRKRNMPSKVNSMQLIGDVENRQCVLVDDMIDTGATLTESADLLMISGAKRVLAAVTHPLLSGSGSERLNRSKISQLVVTDTIPLPEEKQHEKISVVSIHALLAGAIENIHHGRSVPLLR